MLKEKRTCQNCMMSTYNFGFFSLLTFVLNELCKNSPNQNISLESLFSAMHTKNKQYTIDDKIYCDRCLLY